MMTSFSADKNPHLHRPKPKQIRTIVQSRQVPSSNRAKQPCGAPDWLEEKKRQSKCS